MKETYLFILLRKECVIIINDEISNAHLILFAIIRRLGKRSIQYYRSQYTNTNYLLTYRLCIFFLYAICWYPSIEDGYLFYIVWLCTPSTNTEGLKRNTSLHDNGFDVYRTVLFLFFLLFLDKNCILS